jgi:hypothetical protein
MAADETTHLLAEPAPDLVQYPEGRAMNGAVAADSGKRFTLWQLAAFFGKDRLQVIDSRSRFPCGLTRSLGIMLARADTSLVWATNKTVASYFDNLENSSWMMTSFAIGCCVTYPLVCVSLALRVFFSPFPHSSNSMGD